MEEFENEPNSNIENFYNNSTILITGGTGFLGKVLIDKLLRVCKGIERIYLIIRIKKGKDAFGRLEELLADRVFERLRKEYPEYQNKIVCVPGDCSLPRLGLNDKDFDLLSNEVTHVFHGAATVRFDEKLRHAIQINVLGVLEMTKFCKACKRLKAFVHVSTAYSNCPRKKLDEKFYEPPITGDDAMKLLEIFDDTKLDLITKDIIAPWPNTYSFTKAIAESVVKEHCKGLPVAIFRPSIIIGTSEEPVKGWIDNLYGPTGVIVGVGAGLLRVLYADGQSIADVVPVDMAVNALICAAWDIHNQFNNIPRKVTENSYLNGQLTKQSENTNSPTIYHFVTSPSNPLTWEQFLHYNLSHGKKIPTVKAIWYYTITLTRIKFFYHIMILLLHLLPAIVFDGCLKLTGKKPQLLKAYQKIHKFCEVIGFFATNKWDFAEHNTLKLWSKLSDHDKYLFNFNMRALNWNTFFKNNVDGIRLYLFQDDPSTIPAARRKMFWFHIGHRIIQFIFLMAFFWITITIVQKFGYHSDPIHNSRLNTTVDLGIIKRKFT